MPERQRRQLSVSFLLSTHLNPHSLRTETTRTAGLYKDFKSRFILDPVGRKHTHTHTQMLHFFTYVNKHKDILVDQIRYDTLQSQCDLTRSTTPGQHMKNSQHRHTNTQKFRCSHSGTGKKNRSVLGHSLLESNSLPFSTRSFDKYGCYSQTFTWDLMTRRPNWVRHTPIHSLTKSVGSFASC